MAIQIRKPIAASSPLELIWAVAGGHAAEIAWAPSDRERSYLRDVLTHWPDAEVRVDGGVFQTGGR